MRRRAMNPPPTTGVRILTSAETRPTLPKTLMGCAHPTLPRIDKESMATPNRSALIARVLKVVRKHYKPVAPPKDRTVLEHLLFACLVEDSPHEAAEQVFGALKQDYFGWNEVRVSTIRELTDALKP